MNLSIGYWIALILLDLLFRVALAALASPLAIPFVWKETFTHLIFLIPISVIFVLLSVRERYAAPIAVALANGLFFVTYFKNTVETFRDTHASSCINNVCDWVNGEITAAGIQSLTTDTTVHVAISLMVVGIIWAVSKSWSPERQSL